MERFDPPLEHFGKLRHVGDCDNGKARRRQGRRCPARRDQLDPKVDEHLSEIDEIITDDGIDPVQLTSLQSSDVAVRVVKVARNAASSRS